MSDRSDLHSPEHRSSRRTNVRISTGKRASSSRTSRQGSGRLLSTRARRPTPVPRRSTAGSTPPARHSSDQDLTDYDGGSSLTVQSTNELERARHRARRGAQRVLSRPPHHHVGNPDDPSLSWFERLLPEFILNVTSPITGYEVALLSHPGDELEHDILERERLRRNRRIRRRLATILLMAGAASAFMYLANGRLFRRMAVKSTVSSVRQRIEDGISKTVHDIAGK